MSIKLVKRPPHSLLKLSFSRLHWLLHGGVRNDLPFRLFTLWSLDLLHHFFFHLFWYLRGSMTWSFRFSRW